MKTLNLALAIFVGVPLVCTILGLLAYKYPLPTVVVFLSALWFCVCYIVACVLVKPPLTEDKK